MTHTTEAAAIVADLDELAGQITAARDYAASGPDHTHRPGQTAEQAAWSDLDDARRIAERIAEIAARIAGGEYRPAYNGHRNRETWNASLWIDNDSGTYERARDIVRQALGEDPYPSLRSFTGSAPEDTRRGQISRAADALREWWADAGAPSELGSESAGPASDAWTYAVAVADWHSIADGLAEDLPSTWSPDAAAVPTPEDDYTETEPGTWSTRAESAS